MLSFHLPQELHLHILAVSGNTIFAWSCENMLSSDVHTESKPLKSSKQVTEDYAEIDIVSKSAVFHRAKSSRSR